MDMQLTLPNNNVVLTKIPERIFNPLQQKLVQLKDTPQALVPANDKLVGAMQRQDVFRLDDDIYNFILETFDKHVHQLLMRNVVTADITSSWVNYQQRYEYNPCHHHDSLVSFVIWVSVPYDIKEEQQYFSKRALAQKTAAAFEFVYTGIGGQLYTYQIPVSKEYEGYLLMFPSYINHQVYPFMTVDGVRISVAGNIQ